MSFCRGPRRRLFLKPNELFLLNLPSRRTEAREWLRLAHKSRVYS